jgi:hypothetical protein
MQWFRFYDEVIDDRKVQRLPGELFKFWVNILCLANQGDIRGSISLEVEDIAWRLRMEEEDVQAQLDQLVSAELLQIGEDGSITPHGWEKRQKASDDVNKRVTEHRSRYREDTPLQGDEGVTLHVTTDVTNTPVTCNPLEQNREDKRREREEVEENPPTPLLSSPLSPHSTSSPPAKKPTLAVDISKLPKPKGLSVLRALEGAVREIKGKPKLNAFDQGAVNRFYAQHKGGLTEEMVEAAGLEMGEHTDGNALPYFLEVLRRMVEEPENNQPVKRNGNGSGGGTANGRDRERAISKTGGGGEPIPFGSARQPGEPRDAYDARRLREIAQRRGVGGVSQSG